MNEILLYLLRPLPRAQLSSDIIASESTALTRHGSRPGACCTDINLLYLSNRYYIA